MISVFRRGGDPKPLFCLLLFVCIASAAAPKPTPLVIEGDTILVVKSLPCKVIAEEGADLYSWSYSPLLKVKASDNELTISEAPAGTYLITATCTTINFVLDDKVKGGIKKVTTKTVNETTVNIGTVPAPPDPGPGPGPNPPGPKGELRVLITYESGDLPSMPESQKQALVSEKVKGVLRDRCDKNGPGKRGWNIWEKDTIVSEAPEWWQNALKKASGLKQPSITLYKGDAMILEAELPKTIEEVIALVTKNAGP